MVYSYSIKGTNAQVINDTSYLDSVTPIREQTNYNEPRSIIKAPVHCDNVPGGLPNLPRSGRNGLTCNHFND